jgi:hypothetical protein
LGRLAVGRLVPFRWAVRLLLVRLVSAAVSAFV